THLELLDQTAALEKLPALPIRERHAEPLAATGTDGAHSPQLSPAIEVRCVRLRTGEPSENVGMKSSHRQKVSDATPLARGCDSMRMDESGKAPPGFEPGMADLQSAAGPTEPATLPTTSDKSFVRPDGALTKLAPDLDPDLARILAAWPALALPIK